MVNPDVKVKVLGISSRTVDTVCDTPIVDDGLKTLILDANLSTFKTFIISVPTPTLNLSFSFIFVRSPETDINVTTPVAEAVPIPCDKISLSDLIPIAYDPCNDVVVVDKDPTFTIALFNKFKLVVAIPIIVLFEVGTNSTFDMVVVVALISEISGPVILLTLADALNDELTLSSKTTISFIW